jgi:D-alanyl-D-alanine carboxypeptidase
MEVSEDRDADVVSTDDSQVEPQDVEGESPETRDDVGFDSGDDVVPDQDLFPGLDPLVAESLAAIVAEHVTFSADRGVSLTVRDGQGFWWSGGAGVADVADGTPVTTDTRFRVGSNTKPVVAVLVMQLVEEGLVSLDEPLTTYLPDYPQWSGVTIEDLLSMRSGIPDYLTDPDLMLTAVLDPEHSWTPEEVLAFVTDRALLYVSGQGGHYSNSNYLLLGLVIQEVTGRSVQQELQDRILSPLGMEGTFLDEGQFPEVPKLSRGYMDLSLVGQIFNVPAAIIDLLPKEHIVEGSIVDTTYLIAASLNWAAGALVSTPRDMAVFLNALMGGELVLPATLDRMLQTQDIGLLGEQVPYGLGLQERGSPFGVLQGHGGMNFGYQTGTYFVPELGVTVSHMHNFLPEQSDGFQNEVLSVLKDPPDDPLVPCLEPAGFFAATAADGLFQARFKGVINSPFVPQRIPGIGVMSWRVGGETAPLYGVGTSAVLQLEQDGPDRISIDSFSPSREGGATWRMSTVSLQQSVLTELDADGTFQAWGPNAGRIYVSVIDLWVDEDLVPNRLCVKTLSDFLRPVRLRACPHPEPDPSLGATLKVFVEATLMTDSAAVDQALKSLNMPRCRCPDAEGNWGVCPE